MERQLHAHLSLFSVAFLMAALTSLSQAKMVDDEGITLVYLDSNQSDLGSADDDIITSEARLFSGPSFRK